MKLGKKARPWTIRLVVYTTFGFLLWLRFRAKTSVQEAVVISAAFVVLLTVNYLCVRLVVGYATSPKEPSVKLVARSASATFLAIGILGIALSDAVTVSIIYASLRKVPVDSETFVYAIISGIVGTLFTYGGAYELRIIDDRVDYFSFAAGKRSLARRQIEHARVRSGWSTYSDRFRPTNRLELLPGVDAGLQPIIVNLKAFKKPDLDVLFNWLGNKLTQTTAPGG